MAERKRVTGPNLVEGARGHNTVVESSDIPGRPSAAQRAADETAPKKEYKVETQIHVNSKGQTIEKKIESYRSNRGRVRRTLSVKKTGGR